LVYREADDRRDYLLLHYPGGHWDFPKGHMEKGESEEQTAIRELKEETGIDSVVLHDGFRHLIRYRFRSSRGRTVDKQVVFFCGRVDENRLQLSHEHQGYAWVTLAEAKQKVTFANARKLLDKAEAYLDRMAKARASST
jgi:8-oxo-dGTP pyrophosphatase MutT (NUDIX family)